MASCLAALLATIQVPMRVAGLPFALQPRPLGALTLALPAVVMAATLDEPVGALVATRAKSLAMTRVLHVLAIGVATAVMGWLIQGTVNQPEIVNGAWVGGCLGLAASLSAILFGKLGSSILPASMLVVQLSPIPVGDLVGGWREASVLSMEAMFVFVFTSLVLFPFATGRFEFGLRQ